jgi:hypothetical protein
MLHASPVMRQTKIVAEIKEYYQGDNSQLLNRDQVD